MINRNRVQIVIDVDGQAGRSELARVQDQFGTLRSRATSLHGTLLAVTAAFASAALAANSLFDAGRTVQQLTRSMEAITGSTAAAGAELEWLRKTTDQLGQEFYTAAASYRGFLAASQDTAIAGETARDIFRATLEAATALGMSVADTEGSLRAFTQMVSKGNVQAEELRGQLGERLYGAFNLAAQAMGVSTSELNKMLERGEVLAEDLLPSLARVLHEKYGQAALEASNDAQQGLNRFVTAWKDLKAAVAGDAFMQVVADGLNGVTEVIKDPATIDAVKEMADAFSDLAGVMIDVFVPAATAVTQVIGPLAEAVGMLTRIKGFRESWRTYQESASNMGQVIAGRRDWNTGELIGVYNQGYAPMEEGGAGYSNWKPPEIDLTAFDTAGQSLDEFFELYDQVQKDLNEKLKTALQEKPQLISDDGGQSLEAFYQMVDEWSENVQKRVDQVIGVFDDLHDFFDDLDAAEKNIGIDLALDDFFGDLDVMQSQLNDRYQRMVDLSQHTAEAMQDAFSDFFFDAMQGNLDNLGDYVTSFLTSIQKSLSNAFAGQLTESIANSGWYSSIFSAKGNVFSGPGINAYENQVVARPTAFPFAAGIGIMGESGAEAILPLTRTSGGDLGVKSTGMEVSFRVEVKNETGRNIEATASQPQFDGVEYVSYLMLRAVQDDVNGWGSMMGKY